MDLKDLEYGEYLAVTTVSRNGRLYHQFTTWRADFIKQLIENLPANMGKFFHRGDTVHIKIEPQIEEKEGGDFETNIP
jgi:hypothetical protein